VIDGMKEWSRTLHRRRASAYRVALTIDAENPSYPSSPGNCQRLLDVLGAEHVFATFFVQGRWAAAHPECARRIAEEGHLVGSHSNWHSPMTGLTVQGMRAAVQAAETTIIATTHVSPRPWFRCPYGSGHDDPRVLATLSELGYQSIPWDIAAGDWLPEADAGELVKTVARGCLAHGDGARVLLHSWPDVTLAALPKLLTRLRASGAQLVRLDALSEPPGVHLVDK
jgi:peptidoglycan-N-acetylglucosamine deacetylase